MVADRFPEHTLAQCAFKVFTVQTAQRNLLCRVQARFQPAVCGNANTVAVRAKTVAHRANQTDFPLPARHSVQFRNAFIRQTLQFRQGVQHRIRGKKPLTRPVRALTDRHEFNKAHLKFSVLRQLRQCRNLILVYAAEQHGIQLCAAESGVPRRVQTGQRIRERAAARQRRKFILI